MIVLREVKWKGSAGRTPQGGTPGAGMPAMRSRQVAARLHNRPALIRADVAARMPCLPE
jgi:hypothetical protein